jgi:hypothetical protein
MQNPTNSTTIKGRRPKGTPGSALNSPLTSQLEDSTLAGVRKYAPRRLGVFLRAFSGGSRKAAVAAKCIECCGYQPAEVSRCGVKGCPLWRYTPYRTGREGHAEALMQ